MIDFRNLGIMAFRSGNLKEATELLLQAIENDNNDWQARLYLAMTYQKSDKLLDAHRLFTRISKECPDEEVKKRASDVLPELNKQTNEHLKKLRDATSAPPPGHSANQPKKVNERRRPPDDDIIWLG